MKKDFDKMVLINYILLLILPIIPLYLGLDVTFQNGYSFDMRFTFMNYIFSIIGLIGNIILFSSSILSFGSDVLELILSILIVILALIFKYFMVRYYVIKIKNYFKSYDNKSKECLLIYCTTFLLSMYTTYIGYKAWMFTGLFWI